MAEQKRVFLSYDQETRLQAEELAAALSKGGFEAWLDREKLAPGAFWKQQIEEAIDKAQWLVFLVGPRAQPGSAGEWERALALRHAWDDSSKGMVPVLIGRSSAPPFLRDWLALKVDPSEDSDAWTARVLQVLEQTRPADQRADGKQIERNRQQRERRYTEIGEAIAALKVEATPLELQASGVD